MNQFEQMAELLLPHIDKEPEYYENLYPERNLAEGARVVRIAPSPTGYLHLGTLFMALVNRITADSTGGIFYTRIEDTDKKREIEGGIDDIINGLLQFGINIDEGFVTPTEQQGIYAPYKQSLRGEIYQCYVKKLIKEGLAYPCFCTAEELEAVREKQERRTSAFSSPVSTSGATRAMNPLAWQPGLAILFEEAIFARWPVSSGKP